MKKDIALTADLQDFIKGADLQQIGIGCSGDRVVRITKNNGVYFLKYSNNPNIKQEYTKLNWLQGRLLVPQIVSYEEQNGGYYLLTRSLNGEMVCSKKYMQNWKSGLEVIQQAFTEIWKVDIKDCPFDAGLDYKLNHIKYKLDNNLIIAADVRPEFLDKYGSINGIYKYLISNRPSEQLCFSHGDTSLPNIFGQGDKLTGFIDVSDCGIADIWYDIAITAKSIKRNYNTDAVKLFYDAIQNKVGKIKHDIIEYYITLVEL